MPRLLIVDDDPSILRLLRQILSLGYDVTTAESGEAALEAVDAAGGFDGAIVDVMMPGMDGFELVARLRQRDATAAMPLIMLTALDNAEHRDRAAAAGIDAYITKPFEPELLEATLNLLVPAASSR